MYEPTRPPNELAQLPSWAALETLKLRQAINDPAPLRKITPQWLGATTNPAIGNGTLTGHYFEADGMAHFSVDLTMGSTTTFGSGEYRFAPTTELQRAAIGVWTGFAYGLEAGVAVRHGIARIVDGQNYVAIYSASAGIPGSWNTATPHTWGNTDVIQFSIGYRVE